MGEIFALSAGKNTTAQGYLPLFAEQASKCSPGWGIGFFQEGRAVTEKSVEPVYAQKTIHDGFERLARVVESRMIMAQIGCPLYGRPREASGQPLHDHFLDHDWLFTHVGEAATLESYRTPHEPLSKEYCPSVRVFEFIRDYLMAESNAIPSPSFYQTLALGCKKLINNYPGKYRFFLANETILVAFLNVPQILLLQNHALLGDRLLLNTLGPGLEVEGLHPQTFSCANPNRGIILMIAGSNLIYVGHI